MATVKIYTGKHYTMSTSDGGGHVYVKSPYGTVLTPEAQRTIIVALAGGSFGRLTAASGISGVNTYRMFTADYRGRESVVKGILDRSSSWASTGYEKAAPAKTSKPATRTIQKAKPATAGHKSPARSSNGQFVKATVKAAKTGKKAGAR